jgi:tRNA dimethylallyltransferase
MTSLRCLPVGAREGDVSGRPRDHERQPVVFLMGPTASGKTRLAMELAERLPLRVISVDSAMVYRGMDIGTGKPGAEALRRVPHRLIDIRDPDQAYSAGDFRHDALDEIAKAHGESNIPFLVGGTGLYFRALWDGLSVLPPADPEVRAGLAAEAAERGWETLHARLADVDPVSAARIHATDPQRIQRALEIHQLTGCPMSQLLSGEQRSALANPVHALIIEPSDRGRLHADIAARFESMLRAGLVDEVVELQRRWRLNAGAPCTRAVGYRQVNEYLQRRIRYEQMVERGIAATRQLARRQLTWLRAEGRATRFDCHAEGLAGDVLAALDRMLSEGL